MTKRAALLIRFAGVIAIFGRVHYAFASWVEATGGFAGARLFDSLHRLRGWRSQAASRAR